MCTIYYKRDEGKYSDVENDSDDIVRQISNSTNGFIEVTSKLYGKPMLVAISEIKCIYEK